jgi:hypothetical protein
MRLEVYLGEIGPKRSRDFVMLRFQYNVSDTSFRLSLYYLARYVAVRKLLDIIFNIGREPKSSYPRYFEHAKLSFRNDTYSSYDVPTRMFCTA